ncbi:MAG: hypothetical protein HRT77_08350 [Halioglobus sp.]|nr:hypothetical protein [Halioglobus sp.]
MSAQTDSSSTAPSTGASDATDRLCSQCPEVFAAHPVADYIRLLDDTQQAKSMFDVPDSVAAFRADVVKRWGPEALEVFHRVTMLTLMDAFEERAHPFNYPPSILEQFKITFARIRNHIIEDDSGTYAHTQDNFIKDFALCRQTAFPAGGCWVIDHYGCFSRRVFFTGGVRQFFSVARLYLFVTRGHRPLYSPHVHNELTQWHTPEHAYGYRQRVAEMLQRHPEVKGLAGSSWLTDPVVADISPKLRWLREIPSQNGGKYFRICEDIDGGALTHSRTRQKLYEEGKYVPTRYLSIWPRKEMIGWAIKARQEQASENTSEASLLTREPL